MKLITFLLMILGLQAVYAEVDFEDDLLEEEDDDDDWRRLSGGGSDSGTGSDDPTVAAGCARAPVSCTSPKILSQTRNCPGALSTCTADACCVDKAAAKTDIFTNTLAANTKAVTDLDTTAATNKIKAVPDTEVTVGGTKMTVVSSGVTVTKASGTVTLDGFTGITAGTNVDSTEFKCPIVVNPLFPGTPCYSWKVSVGSRRLEDEDAGSARRLSITKLEVVPKTVAEMNALTLQMCTEATTVYPSKCPADKKALFAAGICNGATCASTGDDTNCCAATQKCNVGYCNSGDAACKAGMLTCDGDKKLVAGNDCAGSLCLSTDKEKCCKPTSGANALSVVASFIFALLLAQ